MTVVTPKFGMGASVLRLEDQTFITGKGRYTDDIAPANVLHGHVLRSPFANARFTIVSVEAGIAEESASSRSRFSTSARRMWSAPGIAARSFGGM